MGSTGDESRERQHASAGADTTVGRYRVLATIGSGGMADVFLAVTHSAVGFNKLVVIKRMRADLGGEDEQHVQMFIDEARLAARLSHPNVVHTYEVGAHGGTLFMAMEYLEGQPLKRLLSDASSSGTRIPTAVAVRIVCDTLAGLHYAHDLADFGGESLGVVHRDVSPHNILVTYDGVAKVLDFGIAKASLNSTQTEAGVFKGKANYMAPEQAIGASIDHRADVFAAGIILWELLTSERLFPGSPVQALHNVVSKPIPLATSVRSDVDPELAAIAARALERNVEARYQTAEAMRVALEAYASAKGLAATQQAVREFLAAGFSDVRVQTRKRIDEEIKALRATGEVPAVSIDKLAITGALPAIEVGGATDSASLRTRGTGSGPIPQTSTLSSSFRAQPVSMRLKIVGVIAALAAALVGLGLFLGGRHAPAATQPAPVPAASASAPPPVPSASAPLDAAVVQAPAQGSFVTLVSEPTGATIELDGKHMGTTPLGLPLSNPGSRVTFRVSKDGYAPTTVDVTVPGPTDKPAIASVSLKQLPGSKPSAPRAKTEKPVADAAPAPVPATAPEPPPPVKPAPSKPSVVDLDDIGGKPKVKVVE